MASIASQNSPIGPARAAKATARLLGFYPPSQVTDPLAFQAACVAILAAYSETVVAQVLSPTTGLPARCKFVPALAEIKAACETAAATEYRAMERAATIVAQRRAALPQPDPKPRLTYAELKEKYGETWGIKSVDDRSEVKARRRADMQEANTRLLRREFDAAGEQAEGRIPVSPTLRAMLRGGTDA